MPRTITVTFDDGSTHTYEGVPDNVTPEQATERAQREFQGRTVAALDGGKSNPTPATVPSPGFGETVGAGFRVGMDEQDLVVTNRLADAYEGLAGQIMQATGRPRSDFQNRSNRGLDGAALWREVEKARQSDPNAFPEAGTTREEFQSLALRRGGGRDRDQQTLSDGNMIAGFLGGIGSELLDPITLMTAPVGGGAGSIARIAGREAALNMGLEAVQGPFRSRNRARMGEDTTWGDVALNMAVAGAAGGVLGGAGAAISNRLNRNAGEEIVEEAAPVTAASRPTDLTSMPDNVKQDIASRIDKGESLEQIAEAHPMWADADPRTIQAWVDYRAEGGDEPVAFASTRTDIEEGSPEAALQIESQSFRGSREPEVEDLWPTEETIARREAQMSARLQEEVDAWRNKNQPLPEAVTPEIGATRVQSVVDEANTIAREWAEAPDIEVYYSTRDIIDPDLQARIQQDGAENVKGFVGDDGVVRIFAENLEDPADVQAVLFHESLGHRGMTNLFQERLDKTLEDFYNGSPEFRDRVDVWLEGNRGAYDGPDRIARAADEVLAELSEDGPISSTFMDKLKNRTKAFARELGMRNVDFSDREIRTILSMAHDSVIKGTPNGAAGNGFLGNRYMRGDRPKASLSPAKMRTVNDVDNLLDFLGENTGGGSRGPVSIEELSRAADDLGLSPSKYLRNRNLEERGVAFRLMGASRLLTSQVDELATLGARAQQEGMSPLLYADIREKLATVEAVYAQFDADTSEVGRALRVLREVSESRKSLKSLSRYMASEGQGSGALSNPESLMAFMNTFVATHRTEGPSAAALSIQAQRKLHWEDYAGSIIFNAMLSSPVTWFKNAIGSPLNFVYDFASDGVGSSFGQLKRGAIKADRIYGRELAARLTGFVSAVKDYQTLVNVIDAFKTGTSQSQGLAGKTGQRNASTVFRGPLSALEAPRRIQAGVDELWSNLFYMSNLYGEVAHEVASQGPMTSQQFRANLTAAMTAPSAEAIEKARTKTDRQLFRDTPSIIGGTLADFTRPRYVDEKTLTTVFDPTTGQPRVTAVDTESADGILMRVGRFGTRLMVPFVPTLDSIARTAVRNSGTPLALISQSLRADLMAGGARRQSAMGRLAFTHGMSAMWAMMALEDRLTGVESGDWRKDQATGEVVPPMSIRFGDTWYSYAGYDPIASPMAAVATMIERAKRSGDDASLRESATSLVTGLASAVSESSYAGSLSAAMTMFQEAEEMTTRGEDPGPALTNFAAGQIANIGNPAFLRWVNQTFLDESGRDTSSDGSVLGRAGDRIAAGTPGLSESLPERHDVFGRPVGNARQLDPWNGREVESDPAVLEIYEIEKSVDKVVMGPAPKTIYSNDPANKKKLTGEEYQLYQLYSGSWALQDIREEMSDPFWGELTSDEKADIIKEIVEEARADARAELFPKEER